MIHFRQLVMWCVVILASAGVVFSQANPRIVTGMAATRLFVYQGKPVHPLCLSFPLEASSRSVPNILSECTNSKISPTREGDNFLYAQFPKEENAFFLSFPPGASYRVLANKGDRFLLAGEESGGGSGQFSSLYWVRLTDSQVSIVKDEMGGDRCAGGLSAYKVDGSSIRFSQSASAQDLLSLAGLKLAEAAADQLRSGYLACDGQALYRYDLKTEKIELTGVELNPPELPEAKNQDSQACFDRLVLQRTKQKTVRLSLKDMKALAERFNTTCETGAGR